jgi:hypothetical protein
MAKIGFIKCAPMKYDVTGQISGYRAIGRLVKAGDPDGLLPWQWSVGFCDAPRDPGVWRKGKSKTLKAAKDDATQAVAFIEAESW